MTRGIDGNLKRKIRRGIAFLELNILLTLHGEVSPYTGLVERSLSTKNLSLVIIIPVGI
jgi:hypothetical protein